MTIEVKKSSNEKEWISCRDVLWYLVFCGFAINYMLRITLSVAIVGMIIPRPEAVAIAQCAQIPHPSSTPSNLPNNSLADTNLREAEVTDVSDTSTGLTAWLTNITVVNAAQYRNRYNWNEYEQGLALGGYYWLNCVTQIPGGLLARRYGTKFVFGWSNFICSLLGLLIPYAAGIHFNAFVFIRVLQGGVAGVAWPSMHLLVAKWIPSNQRSKFISSYIGSSVGAAVTYPLSALLIDSFGWESVFYVTSTLGVIWYIAWYYLAFDTPQEHPRISEAEKAKILEQLDPAVGNGSTKPIPWKLILTSRALWATAISQGGGSWALLTLMTESPSYFNFIHGWNISSASWISAAPHLARMAFSFVFSILADWMLRTKKITTTNLRKFAMFVCNGVESVFLLGLAFSGCQPTMAVVFMIAAIATSGALSTGTIAACVDMSPNYATILFAICNMIGVTAGFISPMIVGILTNNNQTIEQWRLVFIIAVVIMFSTGILYMVYGTAELQPWNDTEDEEKGEELEKLRSNVSGLEYEKVSPIIVPRINDLKEDKENSAVRKVSQAR